MKKIYKILIFLLLIFGFYQNSFAQEFNFNLTNVGDLKGHKRYKIGDITLNNKSNINLDFFCWDNDQNGEIRLYLSGTTFFTDCNDTKNNDYVEQLGTWKNIPAGNYELYGVNTQSKKWHWGFGNINLSSIDILGTEPGGTGGISQTFVDLDLTSYDYKPQIFSIPTGSGETVFVDYSIPLSNMNKNLYEIKLLIMIIGLFHLMWLFYTFKNDLLGKS